MPKRFEVERIITVKTFKIPKRKIMKLKPILHVKIWRKDCTVFAQVLKQDFEKLPRGCENIFEHDGFKLRSLTQPAVYYLPINFFIRGTKNENDNKICEYEFETLQKAKQYYTDLKTMLAEYQKFVKETGKYIQGEGE